MSVDRRSHLDQHSAVEDARFVADVAHELRGPLTTLIAAVEVISRGRAELPDRLAAAVEIVDVQVHDLRRLVLDLLDISRFDSGTASLELEPVQLGRFFAALLDARGDRADIWIEPGAEMVRADVRRLRQAVGNLLDNAERYAGGATAVIAERRAGSICLIVDDAGPGIAREDRQRVFGRFERGPLGRTADPRGSGLGLALVSEHVRLHGGEVWVEEAPSGGARFVVAVPSRRV